ncbi:cysteine peptidase family C39 domain-containing protein, partial [Sphaerotilus sp.]|uniref:cysteine peptidase family C39 domain-containing protein n=1 Tax=Sphaerotilus sp. TaxID=2093942 RepID=UPI0025E2F9D7
MNPTAAATPPDSGLWSLLAMAALHGVAADEPQLRHTFGHRPFDLQTLLLAAKSLGLTAKALRQDPKRLAKAPLPAVACDKAGRFFIVAKFDAGPAAAPDARVLIQRAGEPPAILSMTELLATWTGELVFFTSKASFSGQMAQFDFTWFIPAIVKYRRLLAEILLISFVLQLIGLATPLFFQVVMDKVLVNHAMKTLNVIA